jgi:hypothetical protein
MTTLLSATIVRRLRTQGFTVDEPCLADASLGLRIAPALCAVVAAIGTATASPAILFALAGIALLGAVLPFHPVDPIYNYAIRSRFRVGRFPAHCAPSLRSLLQCLSAGIAQRDAGFPNMACQTGRSSSTARL